MGLLTRSLKALTELHKLQQVCFSPLVICDDPQIDEELVWGSAACLSHVRMHEELLLTLKHVDEARLLTRSR